MSFALAGTEYKLLGIELPEGSEGAELTYSVLHFSRYQRVSPL
jgi:hypothetical protein